MVNPRSCVTEGTAAIPHSAKLSKKLGRINTCVSCSVRRLQCKTETCWSHKKCLCLCDRILDRITAQFYLQKFLRHPVFQGTLFLFLLIGKLQTHNKSERSVFMSTFETNIHIRTTNAFVPLLLQVSTKFGHHQGFHAIKNGLLKLSIKFSVTRKLHVDNFSVNMQAEFAFTMNRWISFNISLHFASSCTSAIYIYFVSTYSRHP
jgi:hypothetical protein